MLLSHVRRPAFEKHTHWASAPPTRILFVRHGETQWNVQGIIQGWKGSGLNPLGRRQAGLVAARLRHFDPAPTAVLSSDLERARETAEKVARALRLPVSLRKDLRERRFGAWEGKSIAQVLADYGLDRGTRKDPFLAFDPRGGETMAVFARRMAGFLRAVLRDYAGQTVVAVTHGGPARICACLAAGIRPDRYFLLGRPGNVSLTLLANQGRTWWVERYNDMAHLETTKRRVR